MLYKKLHYRTVRPYGTIRYNTDTCAVRYRTGAVNRNISLSKECDKDIISPLGCNNHVGGEGVLSVGPSSGANLYHDLYQMIIVRGGLGVRVGGCMSRGRLPGEWHARRCGVLSCRCLFPYFLMFVCNDA